MTRRTAFQFGIKSLARWATLALAIGLCGLLAMAFSSPQEEEDSTRRLWNKQFQTAREKTKKTVAQAPGAKPRPKKPTNAHHSAAKASAAETLDDELIGVTLWLLREAKANDDPNRPRLLVTKSSASGNSPSAQPVALLAERVNAGVAFRPNQRLRLGIEVPRAEKNYVYVIDREVYKDGTTDEPTLIFPVKSTPRGDEEISAGRLTYVPSRHDPNPYFTLQQNRADQVSELLTIIISPHPLPSLAGASPTLDRAQIAQWEKEWGVGAERREMRNAAGQGWTIAEKEAGDGQRKLVPGDPLPQIIYRVKAKQGAPILINVPLRLARSESNTPK